MPAYDALFKGGTWQWPEGDVDWAFETCDDDPDDGIITNVRVVPFVGDDCLAIRIVNGDVGFPGGTREQGEAWSNTAIREVMEECGAKVQSLHPFGLFRCRGFGRDFCHIITWADVTRVGPPTNPQGGEEVVEVLKAPPEEMAQLFAERGHAGMGEVFLLAAELRARGIDDDAWSRDGARLLENAYLSAGDVFGGSGWRIGVGGIMEDWELARRVISEAIDRDGTFLDACCANGLLPETMQRWCAERGHKIEPYGLDISSKLIEAARERLPQWSERFFVGNALTWQPPRRFDFVYTLLDVVPERRRADLLHHLLDELVAAGGQLILGQYFAPPPLRQVLEDLGFSVAGTAEQDRGDRGPTQVAWIEA